MKDKSKLKPLSLAVGAAFAAGITLSPMASAVENPFSMNQMEAGYKLADNHMGKEGAMKEGNCGGDKKMGKKEGSCGGDKKMGKKEGSCGGDKGKKEGSCGGDKKAKAKSKEGKCGEGKCGGSK